MFLQLVKKKPSCSEFIGEVINALHTRESILNLALKKLMKYKFYGIPSEIFTKRNQILNISIMSRQTYHFFNSKFPEFGKMLVNNSVIRYITNTVHLINYCRVSQILKVHCKPVRNSFKGLKKSCFESLCVGKKLQK